MRWVSRTVTIALTLLGVALLAVAVYLTVREEKPPGFPTYALFRDASKLPVGSRVMSRGIEVGEITALGVEGRMARVEMSLRQGVEVYEDAFVEKRAASLFGDGFIELHPGGEGPAPRRLEAGEPIRRVAEGASSDRTLRTIDQRIPRVAGALQYATAYIDDLRRDLAGPISQRLDDLDRNTRPEANLGVRLRNADEAMGRFERGTEAAAEAVATWAPRIDRGLDTFDDDVAATTGDLRTARADLQEALASARARLDEVDPALADAAEITGRLDGDGPPEDRGTLAELINDPGLADGVASGVESVEEFTSALDRLKTYVGLRAEWNLRASASKIYVSLEVAGRGDTFYLIEVAKDQYGGNPEVDLTYDMARDAWVRTAVIDHDLRLTAQWGARFDWLSLRFGWREDSFGVGADGDLLGGRLKLSLDGYGVAFTRQPHVKFLAALQVFKSIYVLGGVDDVLTPHGQLDVLAGDTPVPRLFETMHYGRDFFVGGFVRFNDEDLNELVMLYGAAFFALL